MSQAWAGGSTRAWRKVRALVLVRDGYRCQLRLAGCSGTADQVHHVMGKRHGDDPALLVAACQHCNLKVGDPTRNTPRIQRPRPTPRTRW